MRAGRADDPPSGAACGSRVLRWLASVSRARSWSHRLAPLQKPPPWFLSLILYTGIHYTVTKLQGGK